MYRNNPIDWPDNVPHGKVRSTPTADGTLISLGRRSARGGVKHLGVLSDAEMLAVWTELGKQLSAKGAINQSAAA